jgi:hypothetical protein
VLRDQLEHRLDAWLDAEQIDQAQQPPEFVCLHHKARGCQHNELWGEIAGSPGSDPEPIIRQRELSFFFETEQAPRHRTEQEDTTC